LSEREGADDEVGQVSAAKMRGIMIGMQTVVAVSA
jgi:hypothetical protein